ncbi:putative Small MutS-related domain [Klebsormidium nitens]|uniref:Putative Small MutS-related domain n=1 Tax=Klebsormidium nitens TaxID=105231 RepID=A0A1Y1HMS0_KLENI|nr:putative Small MutS-related domain [Klebsormidium nitens]|eukprot:GAQ79914.1 putative Small MutS-related domain [Klebsormidium nitens]
MPAADARSCLSLGTSGPPPKPPPLPRPKLQSNTDLSGPPSAGDRSAPTGPFQTDLVQELRKVASLRRRGSDLDQCISQILARHLPKTSRGWTKALERIGRLPQGGPDLAVRVLAWLAENTEERVTEKQCSNILAAASRSGSTDVVERVFELMERRQVPRTTQHFNMALATYVRARRPSHTFALFQQMPAAGCKPSTVTFNTLISACGAVKGGVDRMRGVLREMTSAGVAADVITYNSALKVLGTKGLAEEAEELVAKMRAAGVRPSGVTYLILIDMYGRINGGLSQAEATFERMLKDRHVSPETAHVSAMMSAYARAGDCDSTEHLFRDLVSRGLAADHIVYVARLTAQGNAGRAAGVKSVFAEMQSAELTPNLIAWTALVDALARCGEYSEAENALGMMTSAGVRPSVRTFTALLDAYLGSGRFAEGRRLLTRMVSEFKCPANAAIYTVQIRHLCHVAADEEAAEVFRAMLSAGVRPDLHAYVCMMSALCKRLEEGGPAYGGARALMDAIGSCDAHEFRATVLLLDSSKTVEASGVYKLLDGVDELTYPQQCDFYSQLIGALWHQRLRGRAADVLDEARRRGVYRGAFVTRGEEWTADLHGVSPGAARMMLLVWFQELTELLHFAPGDPPGGLVAGEHAPRVKDQVDDGRLESHLSSSAASFTSTKEDGPIGGRVVLPRVVRAITGWGKHSKGEGEAVVGRAVGDLLRKLGAPFEPLRLGSYVASGDDVRAWLAQPGTAEKIAMRDEPEGRSSAQDSTKCKVLTAYGISSWVRWGEA